MGEISYATRTLHHGHRLHVRDRRLRSITFRFLLLAIAIFVLFARISIGRNADPLDNSLRSNLLVDHTNKVPSNIAESEFKSIENENINGATDSKKKDPNTVVVLTLKLDIQGATVDVRIHLFDQEAPQATNYVKELATNKAETCSKCTLYRGEPVPFYWGSKDYPDRYFDGGRWGPPYALVQGRLVADDPSTFAVPVPPAESHNPIIERGMVAWAGGKGGPDFFIALAHHPEWGHGHTIFGRVAADDMEKIDALLSRPLVSTKPKRPPIVSNFVDAIPITINMV